MCVYTCYGVCIVVVSAIHNLVCFILMVCFKEQMMDLHVKMSTENDESSTGQDKFENKELPQETTRVLPLQETAKEILEERFQETATKMLAETPCKKQQQQLNNSTLCSTLSVDILQNIFQYYTLQVTRHEGMTQNSTISTPVYMTRRHEKSITILTPVNARIKFVTFLQLLQGGGMADRIYNIEIVHLEPSHQEVILFNNIVLPHHGQWNITGDDLTASIIINHADFAVRSNMHVTVPHVINGCFIDMIHVAVNTNPNIVHRINIQAITLQETFCNQHVQVWLLFANTIRKCTIEIKNKHHMNLIFGLHKLQCLTLKHGTSSQDLIHDLVTSPQFATLTQLHSLSISEKYRASLQECNHTCTVSALYCCDFFKHALTALNNNKSITSLDIVTSTTLANIGTTIYTNKNHITLLSRLQSLSISAKNQSNDYRVLCWTSNMGEYREAYRGDVSSIILNQDAIQALQVTKTLVHLEETIMNTNTQELQSILMASALQSIRLGINIINKQELETLWLHITRVYRILEQRKAQTQELYTLVVYYGSPLQSCLHINTMSHIEHYSTLLFNQYYKKPSTFVFPWLVSIHIRFL
jgi:hypothetical protein